MKWAEGKLHLEDAIDNKPDVVGTLEFPTDKGLLRLNVKAAFTAQNTANDAQNTGNQAISAIGSFQQGIQNGSIIAQKAILSQKALMLRARNDNHWLRCNGKDSENHDCFGLWTTDNKWYNQIRVGATGGLPRGSVTEGPPEL